MLIFHVIIQFTATKNVTGNNDARTVATLNFFFSFLCHRNVEMN